MYGFNYDPRKSFILKDKKSLLNKRHHDFQVQRQEYMCRELIAIKKRLAKFHNRQEVVDDMLDDATLEDKPNESIMQAFTVQPSNEGTDKEAAKIADYYGFDVADEVRDKMDIEGNTRLANEPISLVDPYASAASKSKEKRVENKVQYYVEQAFIHIKGVDYLHLQYEVFYQWRTQKVEEFNR